MVLVWFNNTIIFVKPLGIDPFVYSGFHLHFREFLSSRFADTYYASRIPWIALGYLAHRVLNNEHAIYAEHIVLFYVAAFSLYSAVSTLFANRLAAFAATMLLVTNCWFLLAIGWDYVDGSYVACLLLSLAMVAKVAFGRWWKLAAIVWGAAAAMTISLYILWAILVPIEIGMFLGFNRLGCRRKVHLVAALGLLGAVAALFCMGTISWLGGGKLLYLMPQITAMFKVAANRSRWDVPLSVWLWRAQWLIIPAALWFFAAAWSTWNVKPALQELRAPEQGTGINSRLWIACVFCLAALLIFVLLQIADIHVLDFNDKSRALLPFEFLVLGGALAISKKKLASMNQSINTLAIVIITLAPWALFGFDIKLFGYSAWALQDKYFLGPIAMIGWSAAGAFILWQSLGAGRLKYLLVTFSFAAIGFGSGDSGWISFPPNPFYKQARLAVFEASQDIAPYNPKVNARFWFDAKDPFAPELRDVVSTYLYEYSLINEHFPSLKGRKNSGCCSGKVSSIAPGERVILLTSGKDPLPAANRAIADKNLVFRQVALKHIRRKGIAFMFVVADAVPKASNASTDMHQTVHCNTTSTLLNVDQISLRTLRAQHGGSISTQDGTVVLTTPPQQWAYAATASLPLVDRSSGAGIICVRLRVQEGQLGIGVLARGNTSQMLAERPVHVTSAMTDVELKLADLAKAGSIVFRSWSRNGDHVKALISSIELRRSRPPERAGSQH